MVDKPQEAMASPGPLAVMRSMSNPNKAYQVTLGEDGVVHCSCPAWRFQKLPPSERKCKHIRQFEAEYPRLAAGCAAYRAAVENAAFEGVD